MGAGQIMSKQELHNYDKRIISQISLEDTDELAGDDTLTVALVVPQGARPGQKLKVCG